MTTREKEAIRVRYAEGRPIPRICVKQLLDALDESETRTKALPVKREKTLVGDYRCPRCNAAFIDGMGTTPYCGNCGQRLEYPPPPSRF